MPKSFSDSEREYIKQRLIQEAKKSLIKYGVRKTTVDELVKRVNIPKGTFYLFYKSKELLFFDVFKAFHDEVQEKLTSEIKGLKTGINAQKLTVLIFNLYKTVEESSILKSITSGEMELILRKLPPEIAKEHAAEDDFKLEQLVRLVPDMKANQVPVFSAALRSVFLSMLHKHEIGEEVFDDALKIMINGVVIQMFKGEAL